MQRKSAGKTKIGEVAERFMAPVLKAELSGGGAISGVLVGVYERDLLDPDNILSNLVSREIAKC